MGYTGREFDAETGLYYYRARYYAPRLGQFLQTDPIGTQDDVNLYRYVRNDPLNATDPSGLAADGCGGPYGGWQYAAVGDSCSGAGSSREGRRGQTSYILGTDFEELTRIEANASRYEWQANCGQWHEGLCLNSGEATVKLASFFMGYAARSLEQRGVKFIGAGSDRFAHIVDRHGLGRADDTAGEFNTRDADQIGRYVRDGLTDQGAVVVLNAGRPGYVVYSNVGYIIGSAGVTGTPTEVIAIVLEPSGNPGFYDVITAFPVGNPVSP